VAASSEAVSQEQVGLELAEVAARKKATFEGRANVENGLIIAEDREAGFVRKSTYTSYMHHMGGNLWVGVLLFMMATGQGFQIATNLYLASWSSMDKEDQQASSSYVTYGLLVAGTAIAACTRSYFGFRSTVLASESLHNAMLRAVVRAPVLFFDQNPLGRVLNRFAKDIGCVDDVLPMVLFDFVQCCMMVIAAVIIACSAVPITFIALIPLVWYFLKLRSYYLISSREIKRLDGMSRSPILGILTESLDGLPTVRAFQRQTDFAKTHRTLVDENSKAYFMFIACSRWLGFRLDAIVVAMLLISSFGAVIAKENGSPVDPKLLAVGMLYVIQLSGLFQWCVRQSCEVENLMTSVERVLGFTNLPAEPALHGPTDMTARPDWPEHGEVVATDLQCSYRSDLEPVIKGISFRLKPGKRCGVVGRTGAGKSTLVAAFLRLVDTTAGKIEIDGIDVSQVGLHDLRPRMSVIPQTPFLFSGSLRHNLDPFMQFTDEQIWAAIDASGSITRLVVERLGGGLEGFVEDNGSNFSVGERQLLCLARAVLSRNKIIIMDEATANLDNETDAAVQDAIRTTFSESTVIIIAHRLQTIMDCEQVVVMKGGHIAETGHPHELLSKYFGQDMSASSSSGLLAEMDKDPSKAPPRESLAGMVRETGPLMTAFLRKMALTAFNQR
jgi:ABC-type multidrug transport system fused ATPase/permease subunit